MQDRPDAAQLCDALASFLMGELQPAVAADPRLAFRVLIAANLARIVAAELRQKDELQRSELEGLARIMPDAVAAAPASTAGLGRELGRRIREHWYDAEQLAAVRAHLMAVLRAGLLISNPRFDLGPEIE